MFWFKIKKHFSKGILQEGDKLILEINTKNPKEAKKEFQKVFKNLPQEEDGSFYYLGERLYGDYVTRKEAEDATIIEWY